LRHTYTYKGCQVYGKHGSPDSIVNADISDAPSDVNNASVIGALSSVISWEPFDTSTDERPNVDAGSARYTVDRVSGGHNPPVSKGIYGGGAGSEWPFESASYAIEGRIENPGCTPRIRTNDCHFETIDTSTCYVYEGGGTGFEAGDLVSYNGLIDYLGAPYASQKENKKDNWSVAGIPFFGFSDAGEDAKLPRIDHPLENFIPVSALLAGRSRVNYAGGGGDGGGTCSVVSKCLELGDVLILRDNDRSKLPGCSDPIAKKVLFQLEHYGSPVSDTDNTGVSGFRFSQDSNGRHDWPGKVFTCLGGIAFDTTNWRLLKRSYF
jgi:hypothetical protein